VGGNPRPRLVYLACPHGEKFLGENQNARERAPVIEQQSRVSRSGAAQFKGYARAKFSAAKNPHRISVMTREIQLACECARKIPLVSPGVVKLFNIASARWSQRPPPCPPSERAGQGSRFQTSLAKGPGRRPDACDREEVPML
jgi:hypothetical protein